MGMLGQSQCLAKRSNKGGCRRRCAIIVLYMLGSSLPLHFCYSEGESMFCTSCGKHVQDGARFCDNCGASLQAPGGVNYQQPTPAGEGIVRPSRRSGKAQDP